MDPTDPSTDEAVARAADRAWLGLDLDTATGRGRFEITDRLLAAGFRFYGGAGVSIAGAAMEEATGRRMRWVTAQFVSTSVKGAQVDVEVVVEAHGGRTSQCRVVARIGDQVLFNALGSTDRASDALPQAGFVAMPEVVGPDGCPRLRLPVPEPGDQGQLAFSDLREATPAGHPNIVFWAQVRGYDASRAVMLGYIADYVPIAVMRALGVPGAGTSIDNTIRVGSPPAEPSPWVLIEMRAQAAAGGFGHGDAVMWSQRGELLGIASQTLRLHHIPG